MKNECKYKKNKALRENTTEVRIYKRKQESKKKERKHAFGQKKTIKKKKCFFLGREPVSCFLL